MIFFSVLLSVKVHLNHLGGTRFVEAEALFWKVFWKSIIKLNIALKNKI